MKQIGEHVRLRYHLHYGDPPRVGDVLVTKTRRYYLVVGATAHRVRMTLECLIVDPAKLETNGRVFTLTWNSRRRAA